MYVSYGLNVAIGIAFIISYVIFSFTLKAAFIAIIVALVVLFPFVIRWARNIYINMFVSMIRISRNSTVISDFWDKSFISIAESKEYHFLWHCTKPLP
jgi:ABC-type bacteriocin/lantibiotic exporter with double-glycine peptidase domain